MASYFELMDTYNSYAGTDIVVTAQLAYENNESLKSKCYVLGSLQTISISTHQDKRPVRAIGNINAIDYVMGQRTIAGSLVFAVFDRHFADEIFDDLKSYTKSAILLTDEIPPLNLTISFANEYGKKSKMVLYGVKMVNEGQVMSINDLYTENTYQFVALGMEPLKAEESTYNSVQEDSSVKDDKTYEKNKIPFEYDEDKYFYKKESSDYSMLDDLSSKIDKNNYDVYKNKELYYAINQPITQDGTGIIYFDKNDNLNIFVTDKENGNLINVGNNFSDSNLYVELPQGEYSIQYINKENNEKSKDYSVSITFDSNDIEKNDYPLVTYLYDTSINIESNNSSHDTVVLENDVILNNTIKEFNLNKNKCTIKELIPSTTYEIYTKNKNSKSKSIFITTMPFENYDVKTFIDYIKNNKKMLVTNFTTFDFNLLYNNGHTLVDKILLLPDSDNKTELLLYGVKFQNDFINSINSDKSIKIVNKNILNTEIEKQTELKLNMYKGNNDKEYFCQTFENSHNLVLSGDLNKKHILQGIDKSNLKSLKYNFVFFDNTSKELLKKYSNLYNLDKIDLNKYLKKYPTYNKDFVQAIAAKERNMPNSYILEEPTLSYDGNLLNINLNYKEFLQDEEYYLCISSINDVLDYVPVNKIKFKRDIEELSLNNFEALIYENNYYLAWIEDKNYNKISSSSILSTYKDENSLTKYNQSVIKEKLDLFFNIINNIHNDKSLFDTIYLNLLSYNIPIKDLNYYIEQEVINQVFNSLSTSRIDDILMTAIRLNYLNIKNICDKVVVKNNKLEFINPNYCHMVSIDYYLDEEFPTKTYHDNFVLELNTSYSNYTLVYLVEKSMFNRSGFILINNLDNKIYNFNIDMEVE